MSSSFDITSYSNRYKKDLDAESFLYRPYARARDFCNQLQVDDHSDLISEDLVWASTSLLEAIREKESNVVYFSEAELKTYPTKLLTKEVAKSVCVGFGFQRCVFDTSLTRGQIFRQGSTFIYDASSKRCIEWECSDRDSFPCIVQAFPENVENQVAGAIGYRLILEDEKTIPQDLVNDLIEVGDHLGYDYVAYSTKKEKDCWFFHVKFEAKFQKNETIQIEDKLYHLSRLSKKDDILRYGLQPRSATFIHGIKARHQDRVYLFNGYDKEAIQGFANQVSKEDKVFNKKTQQFDDVETVYAIFEIDRKKIPELKLYRDNMYSSNNPKHPLALYTYSNIPPQAIKFCRTVKPMKKSREKEQI